MRQDILDGSTIAATHTGRAARSGTVALVVAYCAGMLDLVILPVWVGALVQRFHFSPQQAGGVVTLFLLGAVVACTITVPKLNQVNQRVTAAISFAIAAVMFLLASTRSDFAALAILHLAAGLAIGTALAMTLGTMGHSVNPHQLFAKAGMGLGLFSIVMLGALPRLLMSYGGAALFQVITVVMVIAVLACALSFPNPVLAKIEKQPRFDPLIYFILTGAGLMTFNQAMIFAFVEVIGTAHGFHPAGIRSALIALSIVNFILPAPLAAVLQSHLSARRVAQIGPLVQAVLAVLVTSVVIFPAWAFAVSILVAVQIFTHTFLFGLLAEMDRSARATAALPATLLIGAVLGPIVGGALAQHVGFAALGYAALMVGALASVLFTLGGRRI